MIKFFDTHKCEFCGTIFEWECTSFKNAKPVAYWLDDVMKNVKNVHETEFQYIIQLQCPNPKCLKRHFVEFDK